VAYGARLESVLGASPRGFESRILRQPDQAERRLPPARWARRRRSGCPVGQTSTGAAERRLMTGVSGSGPASQSLRCEADGLEQGAAVSSLGAAISDASDATRTQNAVEIAQDLVVDLRAELPRIDARAAAGVALTAAVLVSVVTQVRLRMPVLAVAVAAAALLTVALLLFLMVLLPTPTLPSHQSIIHSRPGEAYEEPDDTVPGQGEWKRVGQARLPQTSEGSPRRDREAQGAGPTPRS
jgi:hypothetical protein